MHDEIMGLIRFYAVGLSACFVGWVLMVGMARTQDARANNLLHDGIGEYVAANELLPAFRCLDQPQRGVYRLKFAYSWRAKFPKAAKSFERHAQGLAVSLGLSLICVDESFDEAFPPDIT